LREVDVSADTDELRVWIDQDLCTGDGLCVQYAPEVFELDIDGLAYVKDHTGELLQAPGVRADVPRQLLLVRAADGVAVAGPLSESD
jgi:ferredoxin